MSLYALLGSCRHIQEALLCCAIPLQACLGAKSKASANFCWGCGTVFSGFCFQDDGVAVGVAGGLVRVSQQATGNRWKRRPRKLHNWYALRISTGPITLDLHCDFYLARPFGGRPIFCADPTQAKLREGPGCVELLLNESCAWSTAIWVCASTNRCCWKRRRLGALPQSTQDNLSVPHPAEKKKNEQRKKNRHETTKDAQD